MNVSAGEEGRPMGYRSERIMVSFAGDGSGDEPLAWGQHELWLAMVRQESWFPLGGIAPLAATTTVADVAGELSYLLSRYQTMRTRLRFDAHGQPRQVVWSSGEIALEIVDAGDADPDEVAEAVRLRYHDADYDFENEWPVRMAVVRRHGVLTHLVSIVCHLVTDSHGAAVMLSEVAVREAAPVVGMAPLEQARWQCSPAGERRNAAAMRYWERQLRAMSPPGATDSPDKRSPRHWQGEFESPATYLAVRAIADRLGLESAPIVLTLFAVAMARVTGVNPVVVRPIVSNRFQPGLANVVAYLAQNSLCLLDVADASFDAAVERTRRASMVAFKYAYFDPAAMNDLIARISRERGVDVDVKCFFSDRRSAAALSRTGPVPTPDDVRDALPHTTMRWVSEQDAPLEALMFYVEDAVDTLRYTVFVDTHFLSPAEMEACLRAMEAMAVDAAFDPTAATRVVAAPAHA
jgi:hypothetical protein